MFHPLATGVAAAFAADFFEVGHVADDQGPLIAKDGGSTVAGDRSDPALTYAPTAWLS